MRESIIIYNSINPGLKRQSLLQGTVCALFGVGFLFFGGIFLPEPVLSDWGLAIWGASILLITLGLIPYKTLKQLEERPDSLKVTSEGNLKFYKRGNLEFSIPLDNIHEMKYFEKKFLYGIGISLKEKQAMPEIRSLRLPIFSRPRIHYKGFDLFFLYFSERGFKSLIE